MAEESYILKPGQLIKAQINEEDVKQLLKLRYGFEVSQITELDAYDDRNYRILCKTVNNPHILSLAEDGYVLKIINSLDSQKIGFFEAQNELLVYLNKKNFVCPIPVKQINGSYYSVESIAPEGQRHLLRLLKYIPGDVLQNSPKCPELLKQVGLFTAKFDDALKDFSHQAYEIQKSLWSLASIPKLRDFVHVLKESTEIKIIVEILHAFENRVIPLLNKLEVGIIHGDLNENNIIVSKDGKSVEAIIDFGDSHKSCLVFELAICLCYMITQYESIECAKHVIEGYRMIRQLTHQEVEILKLCVCARFAQSLVMGTYSYLKEPQNHYLIRTHSIKWRLLKELWCMKDEEAFKLWNIKL
ncbi:unnamed protein product [Trichogramma brassicae]|uniref:Hydroxylysine kinase n=1 Tax=Trichogramma brassicae TaxID=86971 RepID=A0A6H5I9H5_9HYME|nr:unnamed protein product [Trichogramma brassicae]